MSKRTTFLTIKAGLQKQARKDRFFIQEIINDLERHGYQQAGKAQTLLFDWSRELRDKAELKGKTKKSFKKEVGAQLW